MTIQVRGYARTRRPVKIERWVRYSYRLFYTDGTSKYLVMNIAQLEGQTNEDTTNYLVRNFSEQLPYWEDIEKVKLISVDGERHNIIIE